jgi:hypothetical protein
MVAFGEWGSSWTCSANAPPQSAQPPSWRWNWPGPGDDAWALRWSATDPPRAEHLADPNVRGRHDLRHTFATWPEDAGIPARVIDELMGHASGQRHDGSATGPRYR